MAPDHREIYREHADQYQLLVAREDYQHNLPRALNRMLPLQGAHVVELGAGTGRLTCMLAPRVETGLALDASQPMLEVAAARLKQSGHQNWWTAVADHRRLPVGDQVADVVIAGWSICYLVAWNAQTWQAEVEQSLAEMKRALRPGGILIILETLGTGHETPHRPELLAAYYTLLEEMGFFSTWIRTDYQFKSVQEAAELTGFFFGEDLADRVVREKLVVLPECTGIWRLTRL